MNFTMPTTKAELTAVLKEIDEYYKYRKGEYEEPNILPLALDRISFTPETDEKLRADAEKISALKLAAEKKQKEAEYNSQILALEAEKSAAEAGLTERLNEIDRLYSESLEKLEQSASDRNMGSSSAYLSLKAELLEKRDNEKSAVTAAVNEKQSVLDGKIAAVNSLLSGLSELLTAKYAAETEIAVVEAKIKRQTSADEALKYNNQIKEKEIKSSNSVNQAKARLKLDYISVVSKVITKEELNALGYYKDVISACDGYYYTIPAADAYNDFAKDTSMPYYLGDYYQDILYKYSLRKN